MGGTEEGFENMYGSRTLKGHFRGESYAASSAMLRRRMFVPPLPSQARDETQQVFIFNVRRF